MKERLPAIAGALGILGSLACSAVMVLALLGLLGAGLAASAASSDDTTGMSGMSAATAPAGSSGLPAPLLTVLVFFFQAGPVILIASIAAVALAVGIQRRVAVIPVAVAGLILYWGMYLQSTRLLMFSAVGVGLAALIAAYLWSRQTRPVARANC